MVASFRCFVAESGIPTPDSRYLYHGTNHYHIFDIQHDGFIIPFEPWYGTDQECWPDGSTEKRSYWTADPHTCGLFFPDDGKPVIVRTQKGSYQFHREPTGDWYCTKPIKTADLEYWSGSAWLPVSDFG